MEITTGIVTDEQRMDRHSYPKSDQHVENPARTQVPLKLMRSKGLFARCRQLESRLCTDAELELVHTVPYIEKVKRFTSSSEIDDPNEISPTYANEYTFTAASSAVGSIINAVDAILTHEVSNVVAVLRPPGHHAEVDSMAGFCFFNNVAIAARHAQSQHSIKRIAIVDWDIHHGNGIQHIFYEDPNVMYISLHRFDNATFFPFLPESDCSYVGDGIGKGFNMNIAWNSVAGSMGNAEYKAAFDQLVMPVLKQFHAEFIIVASGFDAAEGDVVFGNYHVTPAMYAYMTRKLKSLASGKVLLALEGGYNSEVNADCLCSCLEVMLGREDTPEPCDDDENVCSDALVTINATKEAHSNYWHL